MFLGVIVKVNIVIPLCFCQIHEGRIYVGQAQLEQSCLPNTAWFNWRGSENPSKQQIVVATKDIAAGEYLSKDFMVSTRSKFGEGEGVVTTLQESDRDKT